MKTKIIGVIAFMAVVGSGVGACAVEQPPAACPLPHTSVIVRYVPAAADKGKPCDIFSAEYWSVAKFNEPGTLVNTFAVRPEIAAGYYGDPRTEDAANTAKLDAVGDFDYEANEEGFCVATNLSPIEVKLPEDTAEGLDPVDFKYEIKSLEMVGTAQVPGTQFQGEVTYTEGACTVNYTITGISPGVECCQLTENPNPNWEEDEEPEFVCATNAEGVIIGDDSLCNATTDEAGAVQPACNIYGECLNPDFKMVCDPNAVWLKGLVPYQQAFCMPASETLPSLK